MCPVGYRMNQGQVKVVSLGYSLSADPNITDLFQGEHPQILAGIGEGYRKSCFRRTNALIRCISERGMIEPKFLLRSNRKSYAHFRLLRKSTTVDDL